MVAQRLTTEVFEDTLTAVIIDTVGCFAEPLSQEFTQKQVVPVIVAAAELSESTVQEQLAVAYKVVLCVSPTVADLDLVRVLENLEPFQDQLYIVMPVISGAQEQVSGELPYYAQSLQAQQELIIECNQVLPQAVFVFGQDLLLPPGKASLFDLYCQNIQQGFIYVPNVLISPHTLPSFSAAAVTEVLRPHRLSLVIRGKTKYAHSPLGKLVLQYEGYYFSQVGTQRVEAEEVPTLPFTVKEVTVSEDEHQVALWYSRQLPSPEMEQFFNAKSLHFFTTPDMEKVESTYIPVFEQAVAPLQEPTAPDFWGELLTQEPQEPASEETYKTKHTYDAISDISVTKPKQLAPSRVFKKSDVAGDSDTPKLSNTLPPEEFNVSSEIQRIFDHKRLEQKTGRVTTLVKEQKSIAKKSKKKTTLFYGGLSFVGLGITILLLIVVFMSSTLLLKNQVLAVMAAEPTEVTEAQLKRISFVAGVVDAQVKFYKNVLEVPQVAEAENVLQVTDQLALLHTNNSPTAEVLKNIYETVMGTTTGNIEELAEKLSSETLRTYESANSVADSLQQISFVDIAASEQVLNSYQDKLLSLQKQSQVISQVGPRLPALFGNSNKRTYALILQNNQELRPTGGFMDAVAILTFENGTLIDRQLYSSYEIDKKMPGEVAAPAEITAATGEKRFAFYDANWSPDFPTSAATIEWFLEKSLNTNVDGVLMLDLYGLQSVLEATGPIDLTEYNEVITHKNLLERLEFHSEVVLVETEKNHDYRKVLFSRVVDKLVTLPSDKVPALLAAFNTALADKSLLVSLADADENIAPQNLGWNGNQVVPRCPTQFAASECYVDHAMVVEANVGVNKANYYLKRAVEHTISVSPTQADHKYTLTYTNTAQLEAWPKGAYKNYLRLYVPATAQAVQILVDGVPLPTQNVTQTIDKDKKIVAALVEVPIKSSKQVTLSYSIPLPQFNDTLSYVFFNNEQPGNGETPYTLKITPTAEMNPQLIAPQPVLEDSVIVFSRPDDETSLYGIEFTQAK